MQPFPQGATINGAAYGVFDLLTWCSKRNTQSVTLEEAAFFYENPQTIYEDFAKRRQEQKARTVIEED